MHHRFAAAAGNVPAVNSSRQDALERSLDTERFVVARYRSLTSKAVHLLAVFTGIRMLWRVKECTIGS